MRANIPVENLSVDELLEDWMWLLKKPFSIIAMNNFGDMFLQNENGEIYFLELSAGRLAKVAKSLSEFQRLSSDTDNQNCWFQLGLLTQLERAGMQIESGECFGWKKAPGLGGEIELANIEVAPLNVYVSLMGQIYQQLQGLPSGTKIGGLKIE
jgi:hypothetical protein